MNTLPPIAKGGDTDDVGSHPADIWINSLYTGNVGGDTRNKIRRGFDEGYQRGIIEGRKQIEQEIAGELLGQAQENGR